MWFVSLASGFAVLFGLSYAHRHSTLVAPAYTPVSSALYQATNKLLWGGMLFWVIFACSKGYGGSGHNNNKYPFVGIILNS